MEAAGTVKIFQRSIATNKLRYKTYVGDGDTQSYADVVKSDPNPGLHIKKGERMGHVQKCVGTRLRGLKMNKKGVKLSDGKTLSGKGRLTEKVINTLQNYYVMAIRQNKGKLLEMKKAVGAVLYHCSAIKDPETRHQFCPGAT